MDNYACPETGDGCGTFKLPVIKSEYCSEGVTLELSEIKRIFIAEVDPEDNTKALGGPTNWEAEEDWLVALDNDTENKVRYLYGVGDKPEPEDTEATVHDNQTVVLNSRHTINFDVVDMNDTNYEALRAFQKKSQRRVWVETRGNYLYGGPQGVLCGVKSRFVKERGPESFHRGLLLIDWDKLCDPPRIESPIPTSIPAPVE